MKNKFVSYVISRWWILVLKVNLIDDKITHLNIHLNISYIIYNDHIIVHISMNKEMIQYYVSENYMFLLCFIQ